MSKFSEPKEPRFKIAGEPECFSECVCKNCARELCENACRMCAVQKAPAPMRKCPNLIYEEV